MPLPTALSSQSSDPCHIRVSNLQNDQLVSTLAGFRGACGDPSAASTSAGRWGMSA